MSEPEYEFLVDRTAILTFAAAVGETNPIYWDAALREVDAARRRDRAADLRRSRRRTGIRDYGLRGVAQDPAAPKPAPRGARGGARSGGGGGGNLARVLHGEQRFEYHKPLQPGMKLARHDAAGQGVGEGRQEGRQAEVQRDDHRVPRRSRRARARRDQRRRAHREGGGAMTAKPSGSSGRNPKLKASQLKVGDTREAVLVENLTRTQIVMYAGASGDFNPIHHDETFATKAAGYPSVFAHGMLTMGMTGRLLTDWLGDGVLTRVRRALREAGLAGRLADREGHGHGDRRRRQRRDRGRHDATRRASRWSPGRARAVLPR